jgi:WD40 repeat protein
MISGLQIIFNQLIGQGNVRHDIVPFGPVLIMVQRYRLAGTLKGHSGAINTLTFNRDSSLLASGGTSGYFGWSTYIQSYFIGSDEVVKIWDTKAFRNLETIRDPNGQWGQVTCAKFIITNPTTEVLCFGTGRGHFLVYRRPSKSVRNLFIAN